MASVYVILCRGVQWRTGDGYPLSVVSLLQVEEMSQVGDVFKVHLPYGKKILTATTLLHCGHHDGIHST